MGSERMPAGPLGTGAWARLAGHVARPFYAAGIALQNWRFDCGLGVERAGVPVISVGNLTAGGTGKTPVVVWLVRQLQHMGYWPGVALRGYRELPRPADLDPSATLVGRWSDEVDELLRALPGTPLVAQPDRIAGIRQVLGGGGRRPDCFILDDGFQHRRLDRDFDIVLLDATRHPLEDRLLPLGWMRESLASLGRAHAEVLTRFNPADEEHLRLRARIGELRGRAPFTAVPIWGGLQGVPGEDLTPISFLEGKRLVAACGIGNPAAFLRQLKAEAKIGGGKAEGPGGAGGESRGSVTSLFYPDHHPYPARSVREIVDAAQTQRAHAIVVTDKDWSKLRRLPAETWPCPVVRPLLTMRIEGGEVLMERVVGAIRKGGSAGRTGG